MLTRVLLLFTLVMGSVLFLTGAWTDPAAPNARTAEVRFVPQSVPLDADIIGSGVDAGQLLQKAIEKLAPPRTTWLKTKIRQTMTDAGSSFVAEGFLQRGPNHCARLEMTITTAGKKGRLLVVSDGEVVAQMRQVPGAEPIVALEKLPVIDPESPNASEAAREDFLNDKSSAGPLALLKQIQQHLQNGKLQTGLLQDMPIIQLKGDLNPEARNHFPSTVIPARQVCIYLDVKTLWPHRLEWWGDDRANTPRAILCVEFTDAELNRELSVEECMRTFSYRPNEDGPVR